MRRFLVGSAVVLAVGAVSLFGACGDDDEIPPFLTFRGDVDDVTRQTASAPRRSWIARVPGLGLLFGTAIAQNGCAADDVIACADVINCRAVNPDTCLFQTAITLDDFDEDEEFLFFQQDEDGDGFFDSGDPIAELANPPGFDYCSGDVIELDNVDIDFVAGTYTAGNVDKANDGCRATEPTRTATSGAATETPTPGTPTPTVTAGTPTVTAGTPTETPTAGPTATATTTAS